MPSTESMHASRNTTFLVLALIVAVGAGVGLYFSTASSGSAQPKLSEPAEDGKYHMVLKENGYEPQELVIPKGATVVFSTARGKHHWPASNMHPNHSIYSAFDPKKPIAPEDTWSFTFDRVGTWNLHDHLRSYYRGRITVIDTE